jgi:hypothetical protein
MLTVSISGTHAFLIDPKSGRTVARGALMALGNTNGMEPGTQLECPIKFAGVAVDEETIPEAEVVE